MNEAVTEYTLPLATDQQQLDVVGGKGRSLARLTNAGFNVPGGFHVTTKAYRAFVESHDLQGRIIRSARPALVDRRMSF